MREGNGGQYAAVGTNPFVVAHDPLSTFGADVDTASYDLFRRDVNLGGVPQRAILDAGDLDLQWAIAIAGFAEILKGSPYGDVGHLEVIRQIATAQSHRDADRAEFLDLRTKAWPRLPQ